MRLEQFQYLVEISRCRSMSKAAKNLFITQPALSTSIQHLEEELGQPILKRSSKGVSLTPQGERLVKIAEVIVAQIEEVKTISTDNDIFDPDIHLVAAPVVCNLLITELIYRLKKDHPNVNLNIYEARPKKILSTINKTPATLGVGVYSSTTKDAIITEALKNDYIIEELYEDEGVYLNRTHPLANKEHIFMEDLAPYAQAFFSDYDIIATDDAFIDSELIKKSAPQNYFSFTDRESIKKVVAQGHAYAILPRLMSIDDIYISSGLIKVRPVLDFDVSLTTYIAYSNKKQLSFSEQILLKTIRTIYADHKDKYPRAKYISTDTTFSTLY